MIEGNVIGLDGAGELNIGNSVSGVVIASSSGDTIGGTVGGSRNVISGNYAANIYLNDAANIVISGDLIGTDARGTAEESWGFSNAGVSVVGGSDITIGGTSTLARDVISGNNGAGVLLGAGTTATLVEGDYIGLDQTGSQAVPNVGAGIEVESGGNTIGGTARGAGDAISGNFQAGISVVSVTSGQTVIEGNFIGTDQSGTIAVGNYTDGVYLYAFDGRRHRRDFTGRRQRHRGQRRGGRGPRRLGLRRPDRGQRPRHGPHLHGLAGQRDRRLRRERLRRRHDRRDRRRRRQHDRRTTPPAVCMSTHRPAPATRSATTRCSAIRGRGSSWAAGPSPRPRSPP